jgi:Na+-driven multidrug efflux pump
MKGSDISPALHSPALAPLVASPMLAAPSPTRNIIHLALPMLVAQLAVMLNGTVDTVMAGQISPLDLATVGIGGNNQG